MTESPATGSVFRAARDLLLRYREDYPTARHEFGWPRLERFNWALDWFDVIAAEHPERDALRIVAEGGSDVRRSYAELSARSSQVANWARLNLRLLPKDRTVKHGGPLVDCWVRAPGGETFKHRPLSGRSYRGEYDGLYPEDFDGAPLLTSGKYRVIWLEEAKPEKWREILTHRLTVTDAMLHQPGP